MSDRRLQAALRKMVAEYLSTGEQPRTYERMVAEWFTRDYGGSTADDVADLLAAYRRHLAD